LEEKDLPAMREMAKEPDTFLYIRRLLEMTSDEYDRYLQLKLEQIRLGTGYHWAVWLKTNGAFIGALNLNPIGSSTRLQIGCQLKRDFWGQGFASELTKRVLDFALDEIELPVVYGVFQKDNAISRRLLQKLGFILEETILEQDREIEIHKIERAVR